MSVERNRNIYRTVMLIIVVALVTFVLTSVLMYNKLFMLGKNKSASISASSNLKLEAKLNKVKKVLEADYLGEIEEDALIDAAVKGYVRGLDDEYTEYFSKEEMEDFSAEVKGDYVGIGLYMTKNTKENTIVVIMPIEGSPSEAAGIQTGDVITKVDDKECTGDDLEQVASEIKGKAGSKVKLEIKRDNKLLTFEVERKKIELYPIKSEVLENNIGYIKLTSFDDGCAKKFQDHYHKLQEKNIQSLVIDLRDNGGGIVDEAQDILDTILDKDQIMMYTVNKKQEEEIEKSTKKPTITMPIVVLVNENTASASEIFASAIKENNKGKVIGATTYGKGVIQELLPLSDGSGLKVTTEEYYTAKKNKINKIGVTPDIEVKLPDNKMSTYKLERKDDTQLQKAIETLKK